MRENFFRHHQLGWTAPDRADGFHYPIALPCDCCHSFTQELSRVVGYGITGVSYENTRFLD